MSIRLATVVWGKKRLLYGVWKISEKTIILINMSNLLSLINDTSHLVWLRSLEFHFQWGNIADENLFLIIGFKLVLRWWRSQMMRKKNTYNVLKHFPSELKADCCKLGNVFSIIVNENFSLKIRGGIKKTSDDINRRNIKKK